MKYSLDKVKLKFKLTNKNCFGERTKYIYDALIAKYAVPDYIEYVSEPTECFSRFKYRWSLSLRIRGEKEGTLWLGLGYNDTLVKENIGVLEFNPNKSGKRIYEWLQYAFGLRITEISNCDVAFDVPDVDIKDITIKTSADLMTYGSSSNKTLYVAPKGENRIKIYRKDLERANLGVDMAKTLRIEISLTGDWLWRDKSYNADIDKITKVVERLNSVSWINNTDTNDVTLYLLTNSNEEVRQNALNMMSSATRAKYRKMLSSVSTTLDLDVFKFCDIIENLLKPYTRGIKIK